MVFERDNADLKLPRSITSNSYAALRAAVISFLDRHRDREVLLIGAGRGAVDDTVWAAGSSGRMGVHRFTLTQAAAVLAASALAESGRKVGNHFVSEAVAARVAHSMREKRSWQYFTDVSTTPGFPHALAGTLTELRLNRITPVALRKADLPGSDLATALETYGQQLALGGIADVPEIYELAVQTVREGSHRLIGLPTILLDVSIRNQSARDLIDALIAKSPEVLTCTIARDNDTNELIESALHVRPTPAPDPGDGMTIGRVRSSLFALQPHMEYPADTTLDYFSAPGEAMECVEIVRRVVQLAEDGVPFDRMAVLLRGPEQYESLLEEAFRRADIPTYFSRGVARPDPAGRAFLALLACALENCSASRFAEYLSLGQVPLPGQRSAGPVVSDDEIRTALLPREEVPSQPLEEEDQAADDTASVIQGSLQTPAHWEHLLVDASVIGGADRWERRLNALDAELRLKLKHTEGSEGDQVYFETELTRLENLKSFALPLIALLANLPATAAWRDWLSAFDELARASLRRPVGVLAVLDELEPMADVGPVGLKEVFLVLSERLRFLRREPPVRRYGRVFVGAIEEARGRVFDFVFVPGLAEGVFPRKVMEDPLLLDVYRQKITGPMVKNKQRREHERLLLSIALAASEKRFTFSYPRIDIAQSRPRVPSLYALETIRAALGHLPELRSFQEKAAQAAPSRLDRPAPTEFKDAIDDAEYDLVALDHALHRKGKEKLGAMAYLTRVSEPLGRSLRARYCQWEIRNWTVHDGLIVPEAERGTALEAYRLSARPYSATSLQVFAACPFRFALLGMHGLRPRDTIQPLNQMDPLTRGALFHEAQREFFQCAQTAHLLPVTSANLRSSLAVLDEALNDTADRYRDELAPAIARVWRAEIEEIRTDLHGWLQEVAPQAEWTPKHFELAFGLKDTDRRDRDSSLEPVELEHGIQIRGAIDLVERHATRGTLRVVDHKTGKVPERPFSAVGGGTSLQPLLYALATEKMLSARVESGRLFYCTQRGNYRSAEVQVTEQTRLRLYRALEIIDEAIASGMLPALPNRNECAYCDCRAACGSHEELRSRRKPPHGELNELRSMP